MLDDSIRSTENMYALLNERQTELRTTFAGAINDADAEEAPFDQEDIDFFEEAIAEAIQRVEVPLIQLHQQNEHTDPQEELVELMEQATDYEEKLKKLVDLSQFMLEKNKELGAQNQRLQAKLEHKD